MSSHGLFFAIHYFNSPKFNIETSYIPSIANLIEVLKLNHNFSSCVILSDIEDKENVSGKSIISKIFDIALLTNQEYVKNVWIHFCGHGFINKNNIDTQECIVPEDFESNGIITSEFMNHVTQYFNKNTNVVFVFDCCYSYQISNIQFIYTIYEHDKIQIEKQNKQSLNSNVHIISCFTSDDDISNNYRKYSLTYCIHNIISSNKSISTLQCLIDIYKIMHVHNLHYVPKLYSTTLIDLHKRFIA